MTSSRNPLLIVPIRDRRQHRRLLTIKNVAVTMLSIAAVVAAMSIYSESRRGPAGEYGRLLGTQVAGPNVAARKVDVVHEGPVADQAAPDPMLVAPAAREQLLMANTNVAQTPAVTTSVEPTAVAITPMRTGAAARGTTIVGDGSGVEVVRPPVTSTAPQPALSGGIFKKQ
jgi:hypothetical protein